MKIDYAGEDIRPEHKALINSQLSKLHETDHIKQLKIHLKEYKLTGLRKKFDIHLEAQLDLRHHGFLSAKGDSWIFNLAAKKAIRRLGKQMKKVLEKTEKKGLKHRLLSTFMRKS